MSCIFCKIVKKDIPAEIIKEDENIIAFRDINPKAPIHILIVPKKHISSLNELREEDKELMGQIFLFVKDVAKELKIDKGGYKVSINVGEGGGQEIFHLHVHLLAEKRQ